MIYPMGLYVGKGKGKDGGYYGPNRMRVVCGALYEEPIRDCPGRGDFDTEAEAIAAWNRRTPTPEACESCDGSGVDLYDGNPGKDCQTCSGRGLIDTRTPTPEQAGEVERLRMLQTSAEKYAAICDDLANKTPKVGENDPLWWERQSALREAGVLLSHLAALQSTPPAQPTARIERALHKAAISSSKHVYDAQPTADAVERAAMRMAVLGGHRVWAMMADESGDAPVEAGRGYWRNLATLALEGTTMSGDYVMVPRAKLDLLASMKDRIVRGGPDRVEWEGEWHEGPLATAYIETIDAISEGVSKLIAASPTGGE